MFPSEATFSGFLKHHGVKPATSTVVVYDQKTEAQPYWATRAYWMFLAFGVKNVRVLNGGLPKWEKEGRALETEADVGSEDDYKVTVNHEIYRNFP